MILEHRRLSVEASLSQTHNHVEFQPYELSFFFFPFPIRVPAINPSYELATTSSTKQEQHKYTSKPATTCTTTSSLTTISSSLSYEIVDDFDPYPGYFYVSLFSDLENTEIPSVLLWDPGYGVRNCDNDDWVNCNTRSNLDNDNDSFVPSTMDEPRTSGCVGLALVIETTNSRG